MIGDDLRPARVTEPFHDFVHLLEQNLHALGLGLEDSLERLDGGPDFLEFRVELFDFQDSVAGSFWGEEPWEGVGTGEGTGLESNDPDGYEEEMQ